MLAALALALGFAHPCAAATPYDLALAVVQKTGPQDEKELDELIALRPDPASPSGARLRALLAENGPGVGMFRMVAEFPSDGYMFASERLTSKAPRFDGHIKIFKLLLLDAGTEAARGRPLRAEADLLAATGFLHQLSQQKSGAMSAALVEQLCLQKAYPFLADSIRASAPASPYLARQLARLSDIERSQGFLRAALAEEGERSKAALREAVNPEAAAKERAELPLWKRLAAEKLQDDDFFSIVYSRFDDAVDVQTKALAGAFRDNAPERIEAFFKERARGIEARKRARAARSPLKAFVDGLRGGKALKDDMAQLVVDSTLEAEPPAYDALMPRFHVFRNALNVLRAAIAVKLYRREHRRLPKDLDELVPGALREVPKDSFDGFKPLRYRASAKSFRVYSVGPDGKDDGGSSGIVYSE